ncbi:MAG: TIGR04086 family membrane protein [Lachnospiraceae bacterium]|jgi:putative membrane protein (TIGR04086 family)|nr:TIGR04086 family membrane protein [Lachnospiraceae bacterium]
MSKQTPWLIVRTLIITYLISAFLLVALSFALYKFHLPEAQINAGVNAVYILSCLGGGFLAGKTLKSRRFLWGLLTGLLYFAFLLLMSLAQDGQLKDSLMQILTVLGMCALSGMAGGMLS